VTCIKPADLRWTLEYYILTLYESDGETLKTYSEWPGYYTVPPTNIKIPAVYTVGQRMVPSNWNPTGIELTISDVPSVIDTPNQHSGLVQFERWRVRFTNYGSDEGTKMPLSMLDIRRRLSRTFPSDRFTYQERTEATFESLTGLIMGPVLNPSIP
jgi:hypothetical protein